MYSVVNIPNIFAGVHCFWSFNSKEVEYLRYKGKQLTKGKIPIAHKVNNKAQPKLPPV
jgi:hypothetical protein